MRLLVLGLLIAVALVPAGRGTAQAAAPDCVGSACGQGGVPIVGGSGIACDGVTDDTSALNRYLETFTKGGTIFVPEGRQCLIASGNLNVPDNVTIVGIGSALSPARAITLSGVTGFILGPSSTIVMQRGAQLRDLFIRSDGLTPNPTASQAIAAVSAWGKSSSVAVTIPANTGGVQLRNDLIVGFNTAIRSHAGKFSFENVWFDTYNGVEVTTAADNAYIDNVRGEPFYSLRTPAPSGSWARPGFAFELHGGNTGTVLTRVFSFMYASGLILDNVGVTQVQGSGFEWQSTLGNGVTGTTGIRWINHNAGTSVDGTYVFGFDTPLSDEGIGEVMIHRVSAASATVTGAYLGGSLDHLGKITFDKSSEVGNSISIVFSNPSAEVTHVVGSRSTPAGLAAAIARQINRTQPLIAARIYADSADNTVSIFRPAAGRESRIASANASVRVEQAYGNARPGSYGVLSDFNAPFANVPNITAGDERSTTLAWTIANPYVGNGGLHPGWLRAPARDESRQLSLTGVAWSPTPNVTACGPGAFSHGTDLAGQIKTGAGVVKACTLTFRTPYPWAPRSIALTTSDPRVQAVPSQPPGATGFTIDLSGNLANGYIYYQIVP
jgi:hypothetical protein